MHTRSECVRDSLNLNILLLPSIWNIKTSRVEEEEFIYTERRTGRKTKSKAILSHFPNHHTKPVASANMIHIFSSLCVSEKSTPFPSTTISTHTHSFYPLRRLHDNKIFIFLKWVKSIKKYKCRIPPNLCSLTEYFQYKTCRFLHKYLIPHYGSAELWRWEEKCFLPRRHNSNRCTISVIKDYTKLMIKNGTAKNIFKIKPCDVYESCGIFN